MTDQRQGQDVELDEDEIEIDEAHDPKNAEAASVASVKAGEGKAPTAKKRPSDKSNGMAADTLKTGDPDTTQLLSLKQALTLMLRPSLLRLMLIFQTTSTLWSMVKQLFPKSSETKQLLFLKQL